MINSRKAGALLNVNHQRVCALAAQGRINGAVKVEGVWTFPDAPVVRPSAKGPKLRSTKENPL